MQTAKIKEQKANILKLLGMAGANGLNKSGLKIKSSKIKQQALRELENERKIANLEVRGRYLYVLKEFDTPLEMACDRVEDILSSQGSRLLSKRQLITQCSKGSPGKVKNELNRAIDWLIKDNRLMKLQHGSSVFHLHVASVSRLFPDADQEFKSLSKTPRTNIERKKVLRAYRKIASQTGYSNIEIYRLKQELGVGMDLLESFLLNESKRGTAVLSFGDWSLSSEDTRSGSIEIDGTPHLLVRFKSEEDTL